MASGLKLSIFSPERRLIEGVWVDEITLTGSEGQVQLLPGHAPMVGALETGLFHYTIPGKEPKVGIISSGFFRIKDDAVNVIAETLELKNEINLDRARKAQLMAEETLKAADLDEHQFKKYQLKLQRAIIRQHLGTEV